MTTLVLVLKTTESDDETKYDTFYLNSKAQIIIDKIDIDDAFKSIYSTIMSTI